MPIKTLFMLTVLLCLSACGFQLRGVGEQGAFSVKELNVTARDAYGPTQEMVRSNLQSSGVQVTPSAPYTLYLANEEQNQRSLSYGRNMRGAEQMVTRVLVYQIQGPQGLVLQSDQISAQRTFLLDQNNLTAGAVESEDTVRGLRKELVQSLMVRLQTLTPQRLQTLESEAKARAEAEAESRRKAEEEAARAAKPTVPALPIKLPLPNQQ